MNVEQDRNAEPCAGGRERARQHRMIGSVIVFDPRAYLFAAESSPPQIGRTHATWNKAQTAAQFERLGINRQRLGAIIDARIALMFGAIEIDPGARARRDDQSFGPPCREGQRVGVAVLKRQQTGRRHAQRRAQGQGIVATGMGNRQDDRSYGVGGAVQDKGRRSFIHVRDPNRKGQGGNGSALRSRLENIKPFAHRLTQGWQWRLRRVEPLPPPVQRWTDRLGVIMFRILLAEDDRVMREYLTRALERSGYAVSAVDRGTAALPLIETEHFDLLLTDIVMPEMDGIELAQRAGEIVPDMRVMFITGFAAVTLRAGKQVPNARVLSKPFHLRDLVLEVDRLFELERVPSSN